MDVEEEQVMVYEVVEVDFDYEFDAPRFFDFTRPESEREVRHSEAWFDSASSYPPSPFVAKLFPREDLYSENINASSKSKYDSGLSFVDGDTHVADDAEYCDQDESCRDVEESRQVLLQNLKSGNLTNVQNHVEGLLGGSSRVLSFFDHLANDVKKTKTKSLAKKPSLPRSSTLMKPTASQLAKQNQRRQACDSRSQKNEHTSTAQIGIENQASKRQKLDGGLLRRIVDMKQQINLARKVPTKDSAVEGIILRTKLRITIPREPDLETSHRAGRIRSTSINEAGNPPATARRFKARPLNRKILEAPLQSMPKKSIPRLPDFQAFHLKTTERAKQHASAPTTSGANCQTDKGLNKTSANHILEIGHKDPKRSDSSDVPKTAACQALHNFKARPLDSKILTSRGDIGVFRNSKREITVPKEFEFQTTKRNQQNPPIELFSKLSLNGESQLKSCGKLEHTQRSIPSKGSKENRLESCLQNKNMTRQRNEKPDTQSGKQMQSIANGGIGETGTQIGISRTFGSWRQ